MLHTARCFGIPTANPPQIFQTHLQAGLAAFLKFLPYKVLAKITSAVSKNEIREIYII